MTRRLIDITKGMLALATIAALLVAVPWLLLRMGGFPGSSLLEAVSDPLASDSTKSEQLLAGTLGIIAWFCWIQVAYALIVEVIAAARGTVANRAPLLPGIQAAAARLVTATTLIVSSFGPTASAMAAPLAPVMAFEPALAVSVDQAPVILVDQLSETGTISRAVYTTSDRETFWSIAETTLGDGLRWREVRDANVGRVMADGVTITPSTEELADGWELRLPSDAVLPLQDEEVAGAAAVETDLVGDWIDVENGDHFWSIAEETLEEEWGRNPSDNEIAPYWAEVIEANEGRLLPPGDPNLIYPEQRFQLPTPPADPTQPAEDVTPDVEPAPEIEVEPEVPVSGTESPVPTTAAAPTTRVLPTTVPEITAPDTAEPSLAAQVSSGRDSSTPLAAVALGLGSLSVGAGALAVTLRRRRAHQAAKRKPGTTLAPPPEEANEYERRTRPVADTEAARWVEATNKLITARLAQHKAHRMPAVIAMRAGRFGVEVLLDEPCAPIEGFVSGNDDNSAWRLHPDLELRMIEAETEDVQPYCPALVPVGSTEAGDLLLDLEQLGVLSVEGDDDDVGAWYRSIATGIASAGWSQLCEVVVIGDALAGGGLAQVTLPEDPAAWVEQMAVEMQKLHERLQATPYEQRVAPGEIFHPTIVLVLGDNGEVARKLSEVATLVNSPLAVVAACPLAVAERVHLDARGSTLEPIGVDFVPILTPGDEAEAVAELLENADSSEVFEIEDKSNEAGAADPDPDREPASAFIERVMAPKPIEVRLLRRKPTVEGLSVDPPAKQLSVICYMAYHRSVTSQRLRDTFWPTATSRKTADNAISQVRSMLGLTSGGEHRLTQAINSGEYEINDDVGCDWTRAEALFSEAKSRPADEHQELLRAALELIEGQVGADAPARQFSWLVDDHAVYGHVECRLLDAANQSGELALAAGDLAAAKRSAETGLMVVPGSEAMYRLQMRVAAAEGRSRGVQDAFSAAEQAVASIGPWAEVERETGELFSELMRHGEAQAS